MKILFYDTKPYDKDIFEQCLPNFSDITIDYLKTDISPKTASLAKGYEAICAFVSSDLGTETLDVLHEDRKSTRLNSSHITRSRMPSSA